MNHATTNRTRGTPCNDATTSGIDPTYLALNDTIDDDAGGTASARAHT